MHTLKEQSTEIWGNEYFTDNLDKLLTDVLGYTRRGNYYYSPIDSNFGLYYDSAQWKFSFTFDSGKTTYVWELANLVFKDFNYHISTDETVIYIRIARTDNATCDIIIATDDKNNTMVFHGKSLSTDVESLYTVFMIDKSKNNYKFDTANEYKIHSNLNNAIYRTPSMNNDCLCKELYSIVSIASYPDRASTYINFDDKVYRIVSCGSRADDDSRLPYFAFPVSDGE